MNDQMSRNLSELNDYPSLQHWLDEYCEGAGKPGWHQYGPANFPQYQSDPVKILLMSAESGGYEKCRQVPSGAYLDWIRNYEWTPRQGSVFVTMIREYIALLQDNKPIPPFDRSRWSECNKNVELLIKMMCRTIYMNARITSNGTESSREDKRGIKSDIEEFASYRRRFIQVLKPRIVICAGASARDALFIDGGAFPRSALLKEPVFVNDDYVLVVTRHLSRFGGYAVMHEIGLKCAESYCSTFSRA
jgi:hypothetical protein